MFANKLEEEIYNIYHLGNLQETTLLGSAVEATITSYNSIQASKQASKLKNPLSNSATFRYCNF
jgi:hypothetical protein